MRTMKDLIKLWATVGLGLLLVVTPLLAAPVQPTPSPASKPGVVHWKGQNAYMGAGSGGTGPLFADWIKKATGGRLVIDLAQANAIVPIPEMFKATSKGMLDFAGLYYGGYHVGQMPETDIETGLPFAWETFEHAWDAYYNHGLLGEFQKVYAEHNIYFMPVFPNQIYQIGASFPIGSLADVKGKKIRAIGITAEYIKLLGASPVSIPAPEMYMALKLGTVDGAVFSMVALEDMKLKEVWKYYIGSPNCTTVVCSFLINLNSFNALPDDIKEIIRKDAPMAMLAYSTARERILMDYYAAEAVKKYGFKIITLPDKEIDWVRKEVMKTVWDKAASKSPRNAKLVELVRQQMRKLGKID
jgi:TRAP-type mannitol/chloroaromatic compound transport system substrate-binding protein